MSRLVASVVVLAVGLLAAVDLAGAPIRGSAYLAVPLAVIGLGLVVGAWYGRARMLIAFGVVLSVILAISGAAEGIGGASGNVTWKPTGIEQLDRSYEINVGNAVLDLTAVDSAGRNASVDVHVSMGDLHVVVPSTVDVQVTASVDVGNANVFGRQWSGIDQPEHSILDEGADGPGGGALTVKATVDIGNLEVRR